MEINRDEVIWAAGFFDGEGHCGTIDRAHEGSIIVPHLDITQADRYVLDRFARAVGVGTVQGPYQRGPAHHKPRWIYAAQSAHHVQAIIAMLWTWLSPIKRAQCAAALRTALASARLGRGQLWTRTECKYGHPLTDEANLRRGVKSGYQIRR